MKTISIFLLFLCMNAIALCPKEYSDISTQTNGRIKPYSVASEEVLKYITGKKVGPNNMSFNEMFCLLSLNNIKKVDFETPVMIEHVDLKKLLGMTESETHISIYKLTEKKSLIRAEAQRIKETNSFKKALNKTWHKMNQYESLTLGKLWTVPVTTNNKTEWVDVVKFHKSAENFTNDLVAFNLNFIENQDNTIRLEQTLNSTQPFSIAMLLAFISIFIIVLSDNKILMWTSTLLTLGVEVYGMALRVIISGRAPITNMYETVLFSGFGALFIAFVIYLFKKDKTFILAGFGYNILCLFMMKFSKGMLDSSISPLVPVLRDNFWLSTHVTTIILSYAALALSWILANISLFKQRFSTVAKKDYRYYEQITYVAIQVGVVLLAAGVILGGVWADYSWGRFWGWDPKETWSLIVLLYYMALLHGRGTNWINSHRFIVASSAGFMTVMMAWFGVNYILASGLHSYGFSEGGAIFLGTFFAVQIAFIFLTGKKKVVA